MSNTISIEDAQTQVRQMGMMLASLYYHFATEIINTLGEEEGKKLILKAIDAYGRERGEQQRERVIEAGFAHEPENYVAVSDLPQLGWEVEKAEPAENQTHIKIKYCPYAEYWKEKGAESIGRLYCWVDQAKYSAFHPDSNYVHLKHALEGDPNCEMLCRRWSKE